MKRSAIVALSLLALCAGCDSASSKGPAVPAGEKSYAKLSTNDVLVIVNGKALTKRDVECSIAVQTELTKLAKPTVTVSDLERMQRAQRQRAERQFIERRVMADEALRNGVTFTDEERVKFRHGFANAILRGGVVKFATLVGKLNEEQRDELDSGLDIDMLCQWTNRKFRDETRVTVTDAMLKEKFKELESYNVAARQEEAAIWKNASNAWARISSGEDFEKVATHCASAYPHVNTDMDWGSFSTEFFKDDVQLCQYLSKMAVGSVTPPVTGDNGLLIVKLLGREAVDVAADKPEVRYRLAKIFFALPEIYPLTSEEALRADMEKTLSDEAFRGRVDALIAAAKIEYPNGKIQMSQNAMNVGETKGDK